MASLSKKITVNTFVQLLGKGITTAIGILITRLLTPYLGASGFGDYTLIIFVVSAAVTISNWGLNLIIVREASKDEPGQGKLIGSALIIRFILSLVASLVIFIFALASGQSETLKIALIISSFLILALSLKDSIYAVFMTSLKMENWSISEIVASTVLLLVTVFTVRLNLPLPYLIFGQAIANFLAIALALYLSRKIIVISADFSYLRHKLPYLAKEALPMGAILILFTLYNHIDNILLYFWQGNTAAGIYGLSYKIYDVMTLPAAYLMNSLLPVFSREAESLRDTESVKIRSKSVESRLSLLYVRAFSILLLTGISLFAFVYFFAPTIINFFPGKVPGEFNDSIPLLQILALSNVLSFLNHLTGFTVVAIGKQKLSFYYASLALFINLSLNWLLIPRLSYFGAAWVTVATEGSILLMTSFLIYKSIGALPTPFKIFNSFVLLVKSKGHLFD